MQCKGLSDPSYKVTHPSGNLSDTFNIITQSFCFYYISYLNKLLAFARSLYNEVLIKAAPHLFHQFLDKFQIKKKTFVGSDPFNRDKFSRLWKYNIKTYIRNITKIKYTRILPTSYMPLNQIQELLLLIADALDMGFFTCTPGTLTH